MGLDMSLFKINKKIKNQEELKNTIIEIYNFDYVKRNIKAFEELSNAIDESYDISDSIQQLKNNKLVSQYCKNPDINNPDMLQKYKNKVLFNLDLYNQFLKVSSSDEKVSEIFQITRWNKYYYLDNHFEYLFEDRNNGEVFRGTPFLLSKDDLLDAVKSLKRDTDERKDKVIKDIEDIIENTNFDDETIYYQCW